MAVKKDQSIDPGSSRAAAPSSGRPATSPVVPGRVREDLLGALAAAGVEDSAAVAFAETVGFPSALFGLDFSARQNWQPVATRIQQRAGSAPDAFALAVYDATRVAALAYLAGGDDADLDSLASRFVQTAATYHGTTGWATLNAAGDRQFADFDFWAIRPVGSTHAWTRVAGYDTRSGTLSR